MLRALAPLLAALLIAVTARAGGPPVVLAAPAWVDSASLRTLPDGDRWSPSQPGEAASRTWWLRVGADPAQLVVRFAAQRGGANDRLELTLAYANSPGIPTLPPGAVQGPREIDLTPHLQPGLARLELRLTADNIAHAWCGPVEFWGSGVALVEPDVPWLPPAAYWAPALAAYREPRLARPLPPGAWPPAGGGRLRVELDPAWAPGAEGWTASRWRVSLPRPAAATALILPAEAAGARLRLAGHVPLESRLPFIPLGLSLSAAQLADAPPLTATVAGRPRAYLLATGPLELRHLRSQADPLTGRLRLEAAVVNHAADALDATLAGDLLGPLGQRAAVGLAGYRFPPGASVAALLVDLPNPRPWPGRYRWQVALATAEGTSDRATLPSAFVPARLHILARELPAPADPATLAAADSAGELLRLVAPADDLAALSGAALQAAAWPGVVEVIMR